MATVSMKDVASLAKVSQATVSRAINAPHRLDAETLGRVQAAIASLGYVPDGVARSLRTHRTHTVGMCIPWLAHETFAETVESVQAELHAAGYTLVLSIPGYDPARAAAEVSAMIHRGVDGVVLVGGQHDPALFALLAAREVPYVLVWSTYPGHPSIGFDHRRAMVRLVNHLIDLGHTRIAAIMTEIVHNDRIRDRLLGIGDALASQGLPFPPEYQILTTTGLRAGGKAIAQLLSLDKPPTAIACVNDVVAAGAMLECQRRGLDVPRDISITGFSAMEIGEAQTPAVTTVAVPVGVMGRRAARYLVDRIEGKPVEPLQEVLPTELLVRGSTAAPERKRRRPTATRS